jgi:hypothetical protein
MGYWLDDRDSILGRGNDGNSSLCQRVQLALGPDKPDKAFTLVVKRPRPEAEHSPPSISKVENTWSYTSTHLYVFMTWCLVKHKDNFTFYL